MSTLDELSGLSADEIENIEKLTLRWIFQATRDFGMTAHEIFLNSPDKVQDVAEDITREILDRMPGHNLPKRVYGKVDYKKARYIILPDQNVRQELLVDSKAEKDDSSATIQMSQTSTRVIQKRSGTARSEKGMLPPIAEYDGSQFLTTTAFVHYHYEDDSDGVHHLKNATRVALPNGLLQDRDNPTAENTIWRAGRDAPSLGEDFRARVSFPKLAAKATWRVQRLFYNTTTNEVTGTWINT